MIDRCWQWIPPLPSRVTQTWNLLACIGALDGAATRGSSYVLFISLIHFISAHQYHTLAHVYSLRHC